MKFKIGKIFFDVKIQENSYPWERILWKYHEGASILCYFLFLDMNRPYMGVFLCDHSLNCTLKPLYFSLY